MQHYQFLNKKIADKKGESVLLYAIVACYDFFRKKEEVISCQMKLSEKEFVTAKRSMLFIVILYHLRTSIPFPEVGVITLR